MKKKGCLISVLVVFLIVFTLLITIGILITNYRNNPPNEKDVSTENSNESKATKYNIEDISNGKYYVSDNEYEKIYDRACKAALAWVDLYDKYKTIDNSKLTIYDDGSILMQLYTSDDNNVSVTYTKKDKNGDRDRIAISYDSGGGIKTIIEK